MRAQDPARAISARRGRHRRIALERLQRVRTLGNPLRRGLVDVADEVDPYTRHSSFSLAYLSSVAHTFTDLRHPPHEMAPRVPCALCVRASTAASAATAAVVQRDLCLALFRRRRQTDQPFTAKPGDGLSCFRDLRDDFANQDECQKARGALWRAVQHEQGTERHLPIDVPAAEHLAGTSGYAFLHMLADRVTEHVRSSYAPKAERVGALANWIIGHDDATSELSVPLDGTYAPHVDKANVAEYDISALLYLSTAGVEHKGGLFAFHDSDADRVVVPRAGRLLLFSSGWCNLHRVRPVPSGNRSVLALWYRREPLHL